MSQSGWTLDVAGVLAFLNWPDETQADAEADDRPAPKAGRASFLGLVLEECPRDLVELAVDIAMRDRGELSPALVECVRHSVDLQFLVALEKRMPPQTVNLRAFALELAERTEHLLQDDAGAASLTLVDRATLRNSFALRLSDLGEFNRGLETAQAAVDDAVRASGGRPEPLALRAVCLNTKASLLGRLGRIGDAASAASDAVAVYGSLLDEGLNLQPLPDLSEYWSGLALSLKHRSDWIAQLGPEEREPALADALDSVRIYRSLFNDAERALARTSSAASQIDKRVQVAADWARSMASGLAAALASCSNLLLAAGREFEALVAAEEAHRHFEELRANSEDRFREAFAASSLNLARCLMASGNWELALRRAEAAAVQYSALASIYERLFASDRDAALATLAEVKMHHSASPKRLAASFGSGSDPRLIDNH